MEAIGNLIWIDWTILVILLISALFGFIRGMVREAVALITWIGAIMLGRLFAPEIAELFSTYIEQETVRISLAFVAIAIVVMVAGSIFSRAANQLVSASGFGGFNRFLGLIFGGLRGVAILLIIVTLMSLTPLVEEPWWTQSEFIPMLEELRDQAAGLIDNQLS